MPGIDACDSAVCSFAVVCFYGLQKSVLTLCLPYAMHAGRDLPHHQGLCLKYGTQHIWRMAEFLGARMGCRPPLGCQKPCVANLDLWGFGWAHAWVATLLQGSTHHAATEM